MKNSKLIKSIKQSELEYYTAGGEFKTIDRLCGKDYVIEKLSSPNEENKITQIVSDVLFFALIDGVMFSLKLVKNEVQK